MTSQATHEQSQQSEQDTQGQYDQSNFDTTFLAQVSQGGQFGQTVDWAREYFDSIESQVRSARRVAEVSAISQIRAQIVAQAAQVVRQQIMSDLRRDPSLLKQLTNTKS